MLERRFNTRSPNGTLALGLNILELLLPAPRLILLRGDLGAGKTTLVKGLAEAAGAATTEDVTSPTFTLIHEYQGPRLRLIHFDLYRLEAERELLTLGLDELTEDPTALILIEWGDKFPSLIARADGEVAIDRVPDAENERAFRIHIR